MKVRVSERNEERFKNIGSIGKHKLSEGLSKRRSECKDERKNHRQTEIEHEYMEMREREMREKRKHGMRK